jgi:hypothetical protein
MLAQAKLAPTDVGGYYILSRERHVAVDGMYADVRCIRK